MTQKQAETQISALFDRLFAAWSAGDAKAFAGCFTENADYVTFFGQHLKGREEVESSHRQLFDGVLKGTQMQGNISAIRFLNDQTAIVHCIGNTKKRQQKNYSKNRESINTNVVILQDGEWKITAFHNCRIKNFNFIVRWLMNRSSK
ncbi:SgcJ/EcaC family oxidoreductase [Paenibacillus sp. VCA1]|uniref:SgcJ/EcaC family oxidoreductase n=1 Tax=Paenibacillus sp. VCA1 TaxID=3039148 RepID=UPI00287175D9|nr:SgcJ/EcaC family oxidoreductase [Paenibacillus sp. VCA1]MDR9857014.1 SgcJ/EcaC family oxidoreductase [Paenibacillus sp. VCA1]